MDTVVVNKHSLHFEIGLLAFFLFFELDEGILETISGSLVSYDLTRKDFAKAAKYQLQIFVCRLSAMILPCASIKHLP